MDKLNGKSKDIVKDNIEKLKNIFPEIVTEDKIDFDSLKETLGDYVDDVEERYSFTWNGKSQARRIAQTPSTGTLKPRKEESVNWNETKNLFIEGDNLEVLKLLQKSYHKKVKMIYIDPPYNTGKDFIYKDNYRDNIKNYLEITGQVDSEGKKFSVNSETSGRYHTDWLNMMYPRLKLVRNLLKDDGVIFISIDDNEVYNLRKSCDEIFGEENFIEQIIWKKRATPPNDRIIGRNHEYILVYSKNIDFCKLYLQPRDKQINSRYYNPDEDPSGPWVASDLSANGKGGRLVESCIFSIRNPDNGKIYKPPPNKCWLYNKQRIEKMLEEGRISFRKKTGTPFLKRYLSEVRQGKTLPTIISDGGFSQDSAKELKNIFNADVYEFPKPIKLIKLLLVCGSGKGDIVLDFFAGSATTAHAIIDIGQRVNIDRKFIMIQLPEPCYKNSEAFKAGYKTIAEIGKERIRRVIKKIKSEQEEQKKKNKETLFNENESNKEEKIDLGFKVLKLDSSNIKTWDSDFENLEKNLFDSIDNIKSDRSTEDVLYEILLKYGLDLTVPIEERIIADKKVYSVGLGALIICLEKDISNKVIEGMIELKEELNPEVIRIVFSDSSFKDDAIKTNAIQLLKQNGIEDIRSL